jgi:hypothetical protein
VLVSQGSPALNGHAVELDLDVELDALDLSPRPIKLGGTTYTVRRDLTGKEIAKYWDLVKKQKDTEALALLVGDDAVALNTVLEKLPQQRMQLAVQRIMQTAGLLNTAGEQGESAAS